MAVALKSIAPADAIAALTARGGRLDPSFHWQERYAEDHATAFTVAKSAGFDILNDIYSGLDAALKEGKTYRQFAAELTPMLQAKGWWGRRAVTNPNTGLPEIVQLGSPRRLTTIFDVNMRVSYAAGHWASFERNRATRPLLRYVHLDPQEHPRKIHQHWHNTVLKIDHPWWKTHACPNGWNCHCTIQSLSQRDADRLVAEGVKLKFEAPAEDLQPWTNKVTGETRMIDAGIDPGWDHNPGKAGYRGAVNTTFAAKVADAPLELRDAAITERMASPDFLRFLTSPEGSFPVMRLSDDVATAIGAGKNVRAVALSADTMRKQADNHPDLSVDDYAMLPAMGRSPTLVIQDRGQSIVLLLLTDGTWRYAAVKATATGRGLFLTSFRFTTLGDVTKLLARPGVKILVDQRR